MTRITNADQVLLLLRSHLERARKTRGRGAKAPVSGRSAPQPTALQRVEQLASTEALSHTELRKALIAGLLVEEFGADLSNDPKFSQLVDDTLAMLNRNADASALLESAIAQISASNEH